mgnify:CR=1 FL=1
MADYTDYRLRLRLLSPLGTPMQSDTLFGHLAWQAAWRGGPDGVSAYIAPFSAGEPPFLLSDAFPADRLPRPIFGAPEADPESTPTRRAFSASKHRLKAPFVSTEDFTRLLAGSAAVPPAASPWITGETPHAALDRNTWTTTPGGQFYTTEALYLMDGENAVDIYIRAREGWADRLKADFEELARIGFGRDKSTGHGAFSVESMIPWTGFAAPAGADGFVSLSTFMPAAADPVDGRWRIRVKRGYLGEMAGNGVPYKRAMIQLEPGAVFRTASPPRPWYGRIVKNIAPGMPEAVQCGLALAAACRIDRR